MWPGRSPASRSTTGPSPSRCSTSSASRRPSRSTAAIATRRACTARDVRRTRMRRRRRRWTSPRSRRRAGRRSPNCSCRPRWRTAATPSSSIPRSWSSALKAAASLTGGVSHPFAMASLRIVLPSTRATFGVGASPRRPPRARSTSTCATRTARCACRCAASATWRPRTGSRQRPANLRPSGRRPRRARPHASRSTRRRRSCPAARWRPSRAASC